MVFLLAMLLSAAAAQSQATQAHSLRDTIIDLDKTLFDAFNTFDLEAWKKYLAEDIEFYQDNDDVTATRVQLEPSFQDRCDPDHTSRLRRELVLESTEVHPIQGYGAVQFGAHQFWIVKNGEPDQLAATPKFVHLWRNAGETWQITRVISYGH
jgi:hypothetical protein